MLLRASVEATRLSRPEGGQGQVQGKQMLLQAFLLRAGAWLARLPLPVQALLHGPQEHEQEV